MTSKITTAILLFVFGVLAFAIALMVGPILGVILLTLLPVLPWLLVQPFIALVIAWFGLAFLPVFLRGYFPSIYYHVVSETLVALVWAAWIGRILMKRNHGLPKPLGVYFALMVVLTLVSTVINKVNPLYVGEWLITYLLPLPALALSRLYFQAYPDRKLIRFIVVFLALQMLLNIGWHAGINPIRNSMMLFEDRSIGTYHNSAATAYFFLAAFAGGWCYLAAIWRVNSKGTMWGLFLLLLAGIQFLFAFAAHAKFFLPLAALLPFWFSKRKAKWSPIKPLSLFAMLLLGGIFAVGVLSIPLVQQHFYIPTTQRDFERHADTVWHGPKLNIIRDTARRQNRLQFLFGMGPNNGVSYTALLLNNPRTEELLYDYLYTASGQEDLKSGSIQVTPFSGAAMLFSELGLIGGMAYVFLFVAALHRFFFVIRKRVNHPPEWSFLAGGTFMLLVLWVVVGVVWDVWRIRNLTLTLWMLIGKLWDSRQQGEPPFVGVSL